MKTVFYLINNFAHDLFTGIWFGSFVGIFVVHTKAGAQMDRVPGATRLIGELNHSFLWLGALSLLLVMLTGVVRYLYRRQWDGLENPGQFKKPILIVKHVLLGFSFVVGSFYAYQWIY